MFKNHQEKARSKAVSFNRHPLMSRIADSKNNTMKGLEAGARLYEAISCTTFVDLLLKNNK